MKKKTAVIFPLIALLLTSCSPFDAVKNIFNRKQKEPETEEQETPEPTPQTRVAAAAPPPRDAADNPKQHNHSRRSALCRVLLLVPYPTKKIEKKQKLMPSYSKSF